MQGKREFPAGLRGFLGRARSQWFAESWCVPICHPSKRDSSQHDPHAQVCASRTVLAAGPPLAMESPPSPDWGQQETCGLSQENGWAAAEMWGTVPCPARGRGALLPKPQDLKCKQRQWPALVSSAARFRFPPRGELARCGPGTAATRNNCDTARSVKLTHGSQTPLDEAVSCTHRWQTHRHACPGGVAPNLYSDSLRACRTACFLSTHAMSASARSVGPRCPVPGSGVPLSGGQAASPGAPGSGPGCPKAQPRACLFPLLLWEPYQGGSPGIQQAQWDPAYWALRQWMGLEAHAIGF